MTTQPTHSPARTARRQLLVDRIAEYLTDRGASDDNARAYAADLRDIVDQLGFTLPAALEDTPPLRPGQPADLDGPGRKEWLAAKAALAARPRRADA